MSRNRRRSSDVRRPRRREQTAPARRWIAWLLAVLPALWLVAILARNGTGFVIADDWTVYILSFDYLHRGDLTVLWAAVQEHRAVWSRLLHYFEFAVLRDSRPILYLSILVQWAFTVIALRRLESEAPFASTRLAGTARAGAFLAFAALAFSPIQAWAVARTAYVEIFLLQLGALLCLLGLVRRRYLLAFAGFCLALGATPGWVAIYPTAMVWLFARARGERAQGNAALAPHLRVAAALTAVFALAAAAYFFAPPHPNDTSWAGAATSRFLRGLLAHLGRAIGHWLGLLGFALCPPDRLLGGGPAAPSRTVALAMLLGTTYVLVAAVLVLRRISAARELELHHAYLVFSLGVTASIALARSPILGDTVAVNYAYSAYTIPGWAVLAYLLFHRLSRAAGPRAAARLAAAALACGLVLAASRSRGGLELAGTLGGQRYFMGRFAKTFLAPATAEERHETAIALFHAQPAAVEEGVRMLERLDLVPRNWRTP